MGLKVFEHGKLYRSGFNNYSSRNRHKKMVGCVYYSKVRISRHGSVDRELRQGTMTWNQEGNQEREKNQDVESRRRTKTGDQGKEQNRGNKTKTQD